MTFPIEEYTNPEERVERGASWLDANYPNWHKAIATPNTQSKHACLLCQIAKVANYKSAKIRLALSDREAVMNGFDKMITLNRGRTDLIENDDVYLVLDELWMQKVRERRTSLISE